MTITPEDIERLIKGLKLPVSLVAMLQRELRISFESGVDEIEKLINQNIISINPDILKYLQNYTFDLVKGMNDDLANKLKTSLKRGIMEGKNSKEIAKNIKSIFQTTKSRAESIARTETARAYNYGSYSAANSSPIKLMKYYSAVHDDRTSALCTRLSHKYNINNPIPINNDFIDETTGGRWLFPPTHVNCRSEAIYIQVKSKNI